MTAERQQLQRAGKWVAELAQEARLPPRLAFRLELCLGEALANVVEHGYDPGRQGEIAVLFEASARRLTLVVEDDGRAFDPLTLPPRLPPRRVEDAEPGGLGVPLIRHFAQTCRYERRAGKNRLTMTWHRPDQAGESLDAG